MGKMTGIPRTVARVRKCRRGKGFEAFAEGIGPIQGTWGLSWLEAAKRASENGYRVTDEGMGTLVHSC